MTARGHLRGHPIHHDEETGVWRYDDTGEPTAIEDTERPCGHCGLPYTPEGHDGCLGELPRDIVMNACCGHGGYPGDAHGAYIQYWDGSCIRGDEALAEQARLKRLRDSQSGPDALT